MAKRLIVEVDERELRVAEVATSPLQVRVRALFRIPLASPGGLSEQEAAIRESCAREGVGKGEVDFVVPRRAVEMREINVPPVPNDELPELLRFSAKNEFANVSENWPMDFVPFGDDESAPRTLLAAALKPQVHEDIRKLCELLGWKLRRILLRPFCQVAAIEQHLTAHQGVLVAQRVGLNLDLLIVKGRLLRLNRSVLLAGHSADECEAEVAAEIKRSLLMVGKNQGIPKLEKVLLVGDKFDLSAVQQACPSELEVQTGSLAKSLPRHLEVTASGVTSLEDYVALIGAAVTLLESQVPGVDFANPRKRQVRKLNRGRLLVWTGIAAASLLVLITLGWYMLSSVNKDIQRLNNELAGLKKITEPGNGQPDANQKIAEVGIVDDWNAERVNWLDEFQAISKRFKTGDDVVLASISGRLGKQGGVGRSTPRSSTIDFSILGNVRSSTVKAELENNLAQRPYTVEPFQLSVDNTNSEFPNKIDGRFSALIDVAARTREAQDAAIAWIQNTLNAKTNEPANANTKN